MPSPQRKLEVNPPTPFGCSNTLKYYYHKQFFLSSPTGRQKFPLWGNEPLRYGGYLPIFGVICTSDKHMYNMRLVFWTCLGVKKGDRVAIYLPMIIELVIAMLACARIGAVHSIVVNYLHKILHVFSSYHHIYNLMSYIIFCKSKLFHNLNSILSFVFLSIFPLLQIACKQPPPPPPYPLYHQISKPSHFFPIILFEHFVDYSHFLLNICIILKLNSWVVCFKVWIW